MFSIYYKKVKEYIILTLYIKNSKKKFKSYSYYLY